MRSRLLLLAIAFLVAIPFLATRISLSQIVEGPDANHGPWEMEHSGTTAGLRGVHAAGGGVVWASGTDGTVLRSEDTGFVWQTCAVPPDGAKLDFRGVWAWDGETAVVMSSGPGSQSRLYKTTDGCMSWQLLYTNPDESGFWDAIQFQDRQTGYLLGDPVGGRFVVFETTDGGTHWQRESDADLAAPDSQTGAFAASNSALLADHGSPFMFGTSGPGGPYLFIGSTDCTMNSTDACGDKVKWERKSLPLAGQSSSSGIFSLGSVRLSKPVRQASVAVGGDYKKPDGTSGTAAYTNQDGIWTSAQVPPHGYRSAVAWDAESSAWIAVGPNGSDISYDLGKTWQSLGSGSWNAVSLPWAVGPGGQIGKLMQVKLPQPPPGTSR